MKTIEQLLNEKGLGIENKLKGRAYEKKLFRIAKAFLIKERYGPEKYQKQVALYLMEMMGWFSLEGVQTHFPHLPQTEQQTMEKLMKLVVFSPPLVMEEKCWVEIDPLPFEENKGWLYSEEVQKLFPYSNRLTLRFAGTQEEKDLALRRSIENLFQPVLKKMNIYEFVEEQLFKETEKWMEKKAEKIIEREMKIKEKALQKNKN